ncbi:MAG: hypothetical protein AAGB29_06255 [Planctomycetota bacterium]
MNRSTFLRYVAQPAALLIPILYVLIHFYSVWQYVELEMAMADAFAALMWLLLLSIPMFLSPNGVKWLWWKRLSLAIPMVVLGFAGASGFSFVIWRKFFSDWISISPSTFLEWAEMIAIGLLSLAYLTTSLVLIWPKRPNRLYRVISCLVPVWLQRTDRKRGSSDKANCPAERISPRLA